MIAILPIFFRGQETVWNHSNGWHQIEQFLQRVSRSGLFDAAYAITDQSWVHALAQDLEFDCILIQGKKLSAGTGYFPLGARRALRVLHQRQAWADEELVFLSVRNPFLRLRHVEGLLAEHRLNSSPCTVSLQPVDDHPIQMDRNFRLRDASVLHFLDQSAPPDTGPQQGVGITKPFVFDWRRHGVFDAHVNQRFVRKVGHFHVTFDRATAPSHTDENGCTGPLWEYLDANRARIVLEEPFLDNALGISTTSGRQGQLVGIGFDPDYQTLSCRALWRPTGYLELILAPCLCQHLPLLLILAGFRADGQAGEIFEALVPDHDPYKPILVAVDWQRFDGAVITLQSPVEAGGYDFSLSYPDYAPLWYTDRKARKINCQTKMPIAGRQGLPDVFIPDRNLAIMPAAMADELLESGDPNLIGGSLCTAFGLQIQSDLDWLRAKAIATAKKEAHE